MNGIINLNKPKGITSSDAVAKAKRILKTRTVGHMGTLDPAGEGVLLLGVGKAARLFNYYLKSDKLYEADFTFGYQTDTLDGEGAIIATSDVLPSEADIATALQKLLGKQMQMPPAYSAKSVGGVRAYALARQGKEVILKPSQIEIYDAKILSYSDNVCKVLIHCSSGTYIRSVCRDVARFCDSAATMTAIKRLKSGEFRLEDSVDLPTLERLGEDTIISLSAALKNLKKVEIDKKFKQKLDNGVRLTIDEVGYFQDCPQFKPQSQSVKNLNILSNSVQDINANQGLEDFVVYCDDVIYGIAEVNNGKIVIKTYLKD